MLDMIEAEANSKETKNFKKLLFWACGIESVLKQDNSKLDSSKQKIDTSIEENKYLSNICDLNAVVAMALCGFLYGFFNRFN